MDAALSPGELPPDDSPLALTALATTDPERARRAALGAAVSADGSAQIALLAVAAEASLRIGAVSDALVLFRRAADLSEQRGDPDAGDLLVRLAATTAASGDSALALRTLDTAEPLLGDRAWLAWYHRGLVLHWVGRSDEALDWFNRAEPAAHAAGDRLTAAKLAMNRALANAHVGDLAAAAADAAMAERLCRELGELLLAAHALHNRGWIASCSGDHAEGWRLMHDAAADPAWLAPPVVLADRAELAHAAGLLVEATELAQDAHRAQVAVGDDHGAAATNLLRARIALDAGDSQGALALASEATIALADQGRDALTAIAVEIAAHRDLVEHASEDDRVLLASSALDGMADRIGTVETHPWQGVRLQGLLAAGELNVLAGRGAEAERLFRRAAAESPDTTQPSIAQHAAAALAHLTATGAIDHARLEVAWRDLEAHRALQAVYELRGEWGSSARLLTRVALVPLLDRGDAEGAVRWLERLRPLSSPPRDDQLLQTAQALRSVWRRRHDATRDRDADEDSDVDVDDEEALERALVGRARLVGSLSPLEVAPTAVELASELGDTTFLWVIALPSGTWTVTLSKHEARVTPVDRGRFERDASELTSLISSGRSDWREPASRLDALLGLAGSTGPVVVLPIGSAVEDLAFGAIPSLRDARLRVCWSGAHWLRSRKERSVARVTLAATGVEGSGREIDLLGAIWPRATTLRDAAVTTAAVQSALASDSLVHIGAHGHLRRDNPLLSTLDCADGPLYGYELARSARVASTVLLWSCSLGGTRMPADVGVAGWPTLLAQLGCNALIAAPGSLPSGPAPDLAVEVHRGLAQGLPTDTILTELRRTVESDPLAARAAAMLAVHGAG